ncbi:MAG: excinuclease ABC subunit A, partial [Kiritimatiellae bacterium]|nr:excinuclease ABC subunit A [Kiritimatiellia bacterium]
VGVGYLALDRQSRTLSGGEAQRLSLVSALGSDLVGTLFVLDEPSVGLHPRDMDRLVAILRRLRDAGNTVLVVEHDPAVILAADHVVELGPGPGERGGQVVFEGTVPELLRSKTSVSAPYLLEEIAAGKAAAAPAKKPRAKAAAEDADDDFGGMLMAAEPPARYGSGETKKLELLGVTEHNLKDVDVAFPLGRITAVTGVSGSGKSTLVCDVLYPAARRAIGQIVPECGAFREIRGAENFARVELVDQSPIGKSARSTPASFIGAFDLVRKAFAALPAAKARGISAGDFSFNSGLGRCPACEGSGFEHVEMQFLSDVYLPCESCGGRRYRAETLSVTLPCPGLGRELSIADVLDLTVSEAADAFAGDPVAAALQPLVDVGLGYLRLGQPVPTLSGGEAQRLKLAGFLAALGPDGGAADGKGSLLLFDEPTTGLHFRDVEVLLGVMRRLADAGNTVVVIEHNLQTIRAADWTIDLGPEGGEAGGRVVATGAPAHFVSAAVPGATAAALR